MKDLISDIILWSMAFCLGIYVGAVISEHEFQEQKSFYLNHFNRKLAECSGVFNK
jgi:hypothetical protein